MSCIDVPSVVANGSYSQTSDPAPSGGSLAKTAIFTPSVSGLFRVSTYTTVEQVHGGSAAVSVYWTDEIESTFVNNPAAQYLSPVSSSALIHAVAGDAISISVSASGSPNPNPALYTVYWVVEQIELV